MVDRADLDRRDYLKLAGGAGAVGAAGCFGLAMLGREDDASTEQLTGEEAETMAQRYAPILYFDENEQWFPTDPRPYESEVDGESVVDGFDALDGYTERFDEAGQPPESTVFYRALSYEDSSLSVVQYWLYSAFDQFSTNFHWHDWEVVHVFVDDETEEPQLFVASAHSRKVPNNEFLDPDSETVPRILTELGSHSSALSVNEIPDRFQRLPTGDTIADITNRALSAVETVSEIPIAYGLPRDEGFRLPFVVPELDGAPIYDHADLPSVGRDSLVSSELTVRSFRELSSPPTALPERETGLVFAAESGDGTATDTTSSDEVDADVSYALTPTTELEHITAFTGPQLSFEFPIPDFAEDRIAGHITTTGVPWEQERYDSPAMDVSEPAHRAELADRYDAIAEPKPSNRVVAAVQQTTSADDAPEDEGVTTQPLSVESLCLLESDPEAVPTFNGVAVLEDVDPGDHRLTVNGPGAAPYSERVPVTDDEGPSLGGVDGAIGLTAKADAVKLRVDADGTDADLTDLAVEDDFGGRLYDAPLEGPDAVYVDRRGAYTTEVRDRDGELGAFRVNPNADAAGSDVTIDRPDTGKASLASFVADVATETAASVRNAAESDEVEFEDDGDSDDTDDDQETTRGRPTDQEPGGTEGSGVRGLVRALEAIAAAAERAAANAAEGQQGRADEELGRATTGLERVSARLEESRSDLPEPVVTAVERRREQASRRTEQAMDAGR
ncbi:hypothetical protein [Halorientalis salina]|uniref:hypothetical protein n=1 Tax=Halorientalis salina TaxID=2932266 RepID=UPI0010AD3FBB|nr:hypothetical protein [Halorientalis salina]